MPVSEPVRSRPPGAAAWPAARLTQAYLIVVALAVLPPGFLLIDPWVLGLVRDMDPAYRQVFRALTDLGKSNWMLILTGLAAMLLYWRYRREARWRVAAAYGLAAQVAGFVFAAVAGAGLLASLAKNIIGRARPRHFEMLGAVDFQPFAFAADFASFPSGHATNVFALAGAVAVLWPRVALPVFAAAALAAATRVLVGAHYVTDVLGGAVLGVAFAYGLRNRLAARRWLFETRGGEVAIRGRRLRGWTAGALRRRSGARPAGAREAFWPQSRR